MSLLAIRAEVFLQPRIGDVDEIVHLWWLDLFDVPIRWPALKTLMILSATRQDEPMPRDRSSRPDTRDRPSDKVPRLNDPPH